MCIAFQALILSAESVPAKLCGVFGPDTLGPLLTISLTILMLFCTIVDRLVLAEVTLVFCVTAYWYELAMVCPDTILGIILLIKLKASVHCTLSLGITLVAPSYPK